MTTTFCSLFFKPFYSSLEQELFPMAAFSLRRIFFFSFAAILTLGSSPGWAQHGPEGFGSGAGREKLVEELGLSKEQQEALSCETPGQGQELRKEAIKQKQKLNAMLRDSSTPKDEIFQQFERAEEALRNFEAHRLDKILLIREILTADQLKSFFDLKEQFGDKGMGQDQ